MVVRFSRTVCRKIGLKRKTFLLIATRTIPLILSCSDKSYFSMYTQFVWLWDEKTTLNCFFTGLILIQCNVTWCIGKMTSQAFPYGYSTIKS